MPQTDILIPVYHEGDGVLKILEHLKNSVREPYQVLICYDHDDDPTLHSLDAYPDKSVTIVRVKNEGVGVHGAIMTGFKKSQAQAVIVYPADDDVNGIILDQMIGLSRQGYDIVAPSRFMKGGCMVGCRPAKAILVRSAAFLLHALAGVPVHDPTNGFRLFSRRVLKDIPVQSTQGFTYSIELLVKAQRLGWKIVEVPSQWFERKKGKSRFKILKWLPAYLRWFLYAFETRMAPIFWVFWFLLVIGLYIGWVIYPKIQGKI